MDKKILNQPVEVDQVLLFSSLIDLAISSDSYEQLCQRVVHEEITKGLVHGAHLYSVDSNLDMELQVSHGKTSDLVERVVSAWDGSLLGECLMSKQMVFKSGKNESHLAMPLAKGSVPVGALLLVVDPKLEIPPLSEAVSHLLSKVGAFFMEVRPRISLQGRSNGKGFAHKPEQLTTRQVQIVQLLGAALTNGQIGKELSLSESTIRQETIKIYKALGVSGREEAVSAGIKIGLVSKNL
jgi:DNA-binding NarL/FixJ family response regulator